MYRPLSASVFTSVFASALSFAFILLNPFAATSAFAAPGDVVCDIRIPSSLGDLDDRRIPGGVTADLEAEVIHVAAYAVTPDRPTEARTFHIVHARREPKDFFAVQATTTLHGRFALLEISYFRGADDATAQVGDGFEDDGTWLNFGKYYRFELENCSGLDRFEGVVVR